MSQEPKVRVFSFQAECARVDKDLYKKQYSYEFSGGRRFMSPDAITPGEVFDYDFHDGGFEMDT